MVSAPSIRKHRRREAKAAAAAARLAAGGADRRRAPPLLIIAAAALAVVLVIGAVLATRAVLADPLARGRHELAAGQYRAARVDFQSVLAQQPDHVGAHIGLARALNGLGRAAEARRHALRAQELGADSAALRTDIAQSALIEGRPADALAALDGAIVPRDRARAARTTAQAYYAAGTIAAAQQAFDRAIAIDPADAANWSALARFRLAEQDMTGADGAADEARRRAPRSIGGWAIKALVVRARAGPVPALPWFEAALERDPDDVEVLIDYAATLGDAGRGAAMLVPLRRAAGLDPTNARALFLEGLIAARAGQPALARTLFDRMSGAEADQPAVLQARAAVALALETPAAATRFAQRLVTLQPDNDGARRLLAAALAASDNPLGAVEVLDPITTRSDADAWSLALLARSFAAIGSADAALEPLTRAARLSRGTAALLRGGVAAGDSLDPAVAVPAIRARLAGGEGLAAIALARRLAAANPGVAEARVLIGDAAVVLGDDRAAASNFAAAADLKFDEATMLRLVSVLERLGERQRAADTLAAFMARNPENIEAMRVAAAFAAEQGDWARARDALSAANQRIGPNDALILIQLARAQIELGDAAAALPYAARAYRLVPGNATASGVYGLALALTGGDRRDARDLLVKSVQLAPDDALLKRWLAQLSAR